MLQLSDLKKYIVDELKIAPHNLLCKNKIIKSDYIVAAICSEEIFFPKDCEMLALINCVIKKDYENDYIKRDFIKAFIGEHFC